MLQRVLGVTFAQALRSAGSILLPLAFITLIAWATAGSASGTTADPIRAAMWIWLAAHHVHFDLVLSPSGAAGYLSYLPIGALFLLIMALRGGFKRAIAKLDGDYSNLTGARLFFALFYATITVCIALFSSSPGVRPAWWMAAIFAFLLAFASTFLADRSLVFATPVILALRIVALLIGFGSLIFTIAFFINFSQATLITEVLAPGIFGSLLLLILNILYLPNVAISALSYVSGAGFAVGSGTHLSPITQDIGQIPALPLLAALPVDSNKILLLFALVVIALGALLGYWTISLQERTAWQSFFLVLLSLIFIAYLASGSLITQVMGAVGVSIWQFVLAVGGQLFIGLAAIKYLPRLKIFSR
ncbi:MAG: DUF6350 family protein [Candidatus Planktophila sp.]